MTSAALDISNVSFRWPGPQGFTLSVPAFSVNAGETVLLLGESGSGKSTLLSLICGIVPPQTGEVTVLGTGLSTLKPAQRDRFRGETIGVIFQQFNLLPYASVEDNIRLPLRFAAKRRARTGAGDASKLCAALGLPPGVTGTKAGQLSVGQQQRVAVARALIGQPGLIIADEPTSALDADTQDNFLALLFEQVRATNAALLMVSHDARISDRFDRTVQLSDISTSQRSAA